MSLPQDLEKRRMDFLRPAVAASLELEVSAHCVQFPARPY